MVTNHLSGWFKLLIIATRKVGGSWWKWVQILHHRRIPFLANHVWHVSLLTKEEDAKKSDRRLKGRAGEAKNNRQLNDTHVISPEPPKDILTWGPIHIGRHQCNEGMFFQLSLHLTWNTIAYHHRFSDARWDTILSGGRKLVCVDSLTSATALTYFMAKYGRFIIHFDVFRIPGNFYTDMVWIGFAVQGIGDTRRWVQKGLWCRRKWVFLQMELYHRMDDKL